MREKSRGTASDEAVKSLRASDFGSIEQVRDMARIESVPKIYAEAQQILSTLVGVPLVSSSGLSATLSRNSIEKILSDTGGTGSNNLKRHLLAAGNLDRLYANAVEPWTFELNQNKNNDGLAGIRRLFAPMEHEGDIAVVKITAKEMKTPKTGAESTPSRHRTCFWKKVEDASTLASGS